MWAAQKDKSGPKKATTDCPHDQEDAERLLAKSPLLSSDCESFGRASDHGLTSKCALATSPSTIFLCWRWCSMHGEPVLTDHLANRASDCALEVGDPSCKSVVVGGP